MRASLLTWFAREARPLAWRESPRDPYRTLVAETMLQQTQAARVEAPYLAFVRTFPTVADLAAADLGEVLHAWQGLGYYRRARALHGAARQIVAQHGGALPADVQALERLPGVGRYTAAAVAAQAFGIPAVAVDANVRRVGRRVLGRAGASDDAIAAGLSATLLVPRGPAAERRAQVAEALIELGARVCRPRAPRCSACPLAGGCAAASAPPAAFDPAPRARRPRRECLHVLVAHRGGEVALVRRSEDGRWGGLWAFPTTEPGRTRDLRALPPIRHDLTHRALEVTPYLAEGVAAPADAVWVALGDVAAGRAIVPVSSLERRVAASVLASGATGG